MNLGGTLFTHNCIQLDYCFELSLQSLLHVCDKVVVVDAESTDGTREKLQEYGDKITLISAPWKPVVTGTGQWLADLANLARSKLDTRMHLSLQADEVLDPAEREIIRAQAQDKVTWQMPRLNFWRDPQHMVPHGKVCGDNIIRLGPADVPLVNDAENLSPWGHRYPNKQGSARIFHYGFLRRTPALIEKGISMEENVFGTHNPLYDQMKTDGRRPFDEHIPLNELIPYHGPHPALAHGWLREHGFNI